MVRGVTGWQGNDGGQGGWNQPPNGPQGGDPHQHPYNPDPYGHNAGPQGTARYPYGPAEGGNPYQTGGFPAQGAGYGADPYAQDPYAQNQYAQHTGRIRTGSTTRIRAAVSRNRTSAPDRRSARRRR